MDNRKWWTIQMFADGGEGAAAPGSTEGETPAAEAEQSAEKASFDDLLKDADYKKAFDNRVRSAVRNRFKAVDEEKAALQPMYEALCRKYSIDVSDPDNIDLKALAAAVSADDDLFEKEAAEMGVTVEGLRKIRTAERQMREVDRARKEEQSRQAWQALQTESEQLKHVYPSFDMEKEFNDPQFGKLVASLQANGFTAPLRTAFESVHRDELMSGAMQYAAQRTKQQIANGIQSGSVRPNEAGAAQTAVQAAIDPSKLTRKQIADIRERAMRGEKITFR